MKPSLSAPAAATESPYSVPAQWSWHLQTLLTLRRRLQQQAHRHLVEAETLDRADSEFGARATEESEFNTLLAEAKTEENLLTEIEAALQRLRQGTYGVCVATRQPIPGDRVRALPWTRFTRDAAARRSTGAFPAGHA